MTSACARSPSRRSRRQASSVLRRAILSCALVACLSGQDPGTKPAARKPDPYTAGEPAALAAAGYVSFGPFPWADGHDTEKIESVLGLQPVWIETQHFKIGCQLPSCPLPADKDQRGKLQDELKRLARKLPKVKTSPRELDPWLRAHLIAQRCEELYADFQKRAGVTDEDFSKPTPNTPEAYMGEGPYLGQLDKFLVLIVHKNSALGRYGTRFLNREIKESQRWNFSGSGSMLVVASLEQSNGRVSSETELHCHLAFNLAHNFTDAFKHYWYRLPAWIIEGLAHWYSRRVDPEFPHFSALPAAEDALRKEWDWPPKVRARVRHGAFTPFDKLGAVFELEELKFGDHLACWSRIDFLLQQEPEKFSAFLKRMKGKIPAAGQIPTKDEVLARQADSLQQVYGWDGKAFDQAWSKWVVEKYPEK